MGFVIELSKAWAHVILWFPQFSSRIVFWNQCHDVTPGFSSVHDKLLHLEENSHWKLYPDILSRKSNSCIIFMPYSLSRCARIAVSTGHILGREHSFRQWQKARCCWWNLMWDTNLSAALFWPVQIYSHYCQNKCQHLTEKNKKEGQLP